MMKLIPFFLCASVCLATDAPRVVGVPPADAGRGFIRVSPTEIRHYAGRSGVKGYIVSQDNGETWKNVNTHPAKARWEAGAFAWLPVQKKFIRVDPIKSTIFLADSIDGPWEVTTTSGKLIPESELKASGEKLFIPEGIRRSPMAVNKGKRILFPSHDATNGTYIYFSDDNGQSWKKSKDTIKTPLFEVKPPHQGVRWGNNGVEASIVELKDGRLWALVRTSLDEHWQSFSKDFGDTWSKPEPSRFYGTLTMPTIGRLDDGRLIALWTNQAALAELPHGRPARSEDVFTNRDSQHIALSKDDGKTWYGFREIYLNPFRNDGDYATKGGSDIGSHQSEFIDLGKGKVLVALGQHPIQRKMLIVDLDWVAETERSCDFSNGLEDWMTHSFIPIYKGHCAYNRKQTASIEQVDGKPAMHIKFVDDAELTNTDEKSQADYRAGGGTWNFPNAERGKLDIQLNFPEGSEGVHLSLADRQFNGCDVHAPEQSIFSVKLGTGKDSAIKGLKPGKTYTITLQWNGVKKGSACKVLVNGKEAATLRAQNDSPNGLSYVHLISAATAPDAGVYCLGTKMQASKPKK